MVFILDDFDLFAKPFKQTVLYNLLDALQTSSVQARPLCMASLSAKFPSLLLEEPLAHLS